MEALIPLFLGIGYVAGFFISMFIHTRYWRREVINRGHAHYHPKTGVFTWGKPE